MIVTLLTDFGTKDHYVAVMKGVIARICPAAQVIDISHEVEPFQIAEGAYLLSQAWRWFPEWTVHVAVVDPGVGSKRRPIAAQAEGHTFVLPDNGLLSQLGATEITVREIADEAFMLQPVSRTFHGRDIFAPTAAFLASGVAFEEVGPEVRDWLRLPPDRGSVLHVDRFGNIVTGMRASVCRGQAIRLGATVVDRRVMSYADAPANELFLIEGSGGYMEVSLREASAAQRIGCRAGDPITLEPVDKN